ncbi:MAG: hypothetical protein Q9217_000523 [Psora testacea]
MASPSLTAPPTTPPDAVRAPMMTVQPHSDHALNAGGKAGVVVGSIFGAAVLLAAVFGVWWYKKRSSRGLLSHVPRKDDSRREYMFGTPEDVAHLQGPHEESKVEEDPRPKSELSGVPAERPKSELPG